MLGRRSSATCAHCADGPGATHLHAFTVGNTVPIVDAACTAPRLEKGAAIRAGERFLSPASNGATMGATSPHTTLYFCPASLGATGSSGFNPGRVARLDADGGLQPCATPVASPSRHGARGHGAFRAAMVGRVRCMRSQRWDRPCQRGARGGPQPQCRTSGLPRGERTLH